jgi:hypothetical protein
MTGKKRNDNINGRKEEKRERWLEGMNKNKNGRNKSRNSEGRTHETEA